MEKRIYITTGFLGSKMILPQLVEYSTKTEQISQAELKEELENCTNVFSSIKNGALNNTLLKKGIVWEQIEKIQANIGDVIIEIQVVGLKDLLVKYSDQPELPKYCTMVFRRITIC